MYDRDRRLSLWYFNLRGVFINHPEARISVTNAITRISRDGEVLIERKLGDDIDQNNWIGKMQAHHLLEAYERLTQMA